MDNRTIEQVRDNEDRLIDKNIRLEKKLDLYKSVLDEIREYIKEKERDGTLWSVKATDDLLQVLDKVK